MKYFVAYTTLFDNEIVGKVVEANSEVEAAELYLDQNTEWDRMGFDGYENLEELKNELFNGDALISVFLLD